MRDTKLVARFAGSTIDFVLYLREDGIRQTGGSYAVKTIQLADIDGNVLLTDAGPYAADTNGKIEFSGTLLSTPTRGTPMILTFLADYNATTDLKLVETLVYI